MTGLALLNKSGHKFRLSLVIAVASFLWTITLQTRAGPEDDVFQQAVNYLFTGKIDPGVGPEIVDRKSCVVVVPEKFGGYARYYLTRFKMDDARISNKYSGREVSYELEGRRNANGLIVTISPEFDPHVSPAMLCSIPLASRTSTGVNSTPSDDVTALDCGQLASSGSYWRDLE